MDTKSKIMFTRINIAPPYFLTHLLFVDDIVIFSSRDISQFMILNDILELFSSTTRMMVNWGKYVVYDLGLSVVQEGFPLATVFNGASSLFFSSKIGFM